MINVCYVAIPQEWESPKGVIMRTALHNGYQTVASMCMFLEVPCTDDGLDLLTEQSSLFSKLALAAPEIAQLLSANSYSMKNTDSALWIIDETSLQRTEFSHHFTYCPECLRDEIVSIFQDIRNLPVCPLHHTQIISKCPACQQSEHWTTAHLLFCKCGLDRRHTKSQVIAIINEEHLDTFGPNSTIRNISYMTELAETCETLWQSRKPNEEQKLCFLMREIRTHALKMITAQQSKYPGFSRKLHLSPWQSSHPLLTTLAKNAFVEPSTLNAECITGSCCVKVELTASEILDSIESITDSDTIKNIISNDFDWHLHGTHMRYYTCHIPICRLIRLTNNSTLYSIAKKEALELNYYSTPDAGKRLQCSCGTIRQLAQLGYLQRKTNYRKSGSGHRVLISRRSVDSFAKNFYLVGQIANMLQTTPIKTVRLLSQHGISSDHNNLGPYVYEQSKIYAVLEKIKSAVAYPSQLYPIALPPTQPIQNTLSLHITNKEEAEKTERDTLTEESSPATNNNCYTHHQTATFLNISGRLLYYRFVLTGLVTPETTDGAAYYSLAQIQKMSDHLQQHVSIEQITKTWKCGRNKATFLINTYKLQPSCALVYSNGDRQLLFSKHEVDSLKNREQTKKRKGTLKRSKLTPKTPTLHELPVVIPIS